MNEQCQARIKMCEARRVLAEKKRKRSENFSDELGRIASDFQNWSGNFVSCFNKLSKSSFKVNQLNMQIKMTLDEHKNDNCLFKVQVKTRTRQHRK